MAKIQDQAKVRISPAKAQQMYPQSKEKRVLNHLVIREVHSDANLTDLPLPVREFALEVLDWRRGRRIWIVRDPNSQGGTTVLVTNH